MKKLIIIVLAVNAVLLVGRLWQGMLDARADCEATRNGDVNGDGNRDISDAIDLLGWLFTGGPEPCAMAKEPALTEEQRRLLEDLEFGRKIAGTWISGGTLSTITASGTYIDSDMNDFKNIHGGFDSPTRGTWRCTGEREMTITALVGRFDREGNLVDFRKAIWRIEIAEDFETISGREWWEIYGPDEISPHSCDAVPLESGGPIEFTAERLCVEELP